MLRIDVGRWNQTAEDLREGRQVRLIPARESAFCTL